ncbi:MAG: YaaA family protein [Campylobacter sp.]|nr:YaaA family protein [Campylobacter sp.]
MKILFSPSEAKSSLSSKIKVCEKNFTFPQLYAKRLEILNSYEKFIENATDSELCKLFGLKKFSQNLRENLFEKGCIKAIERYSGVAYEALGYALLDKKAKTYIDENTIIFSNLFGPVLGGDLLPEYKLKQGEKFGGLNLEKFYNENFSQCLDEFLRDELIIDLRAAFYEKFYEIKSEFYTFKFIKNKKVLSHYAKAYRGKVLKQLAINKILNKNDLFSLNFENLRLIDIKQIKLKTEILFEIS